MFIRLGSAGQMFRCTRVFRASKQFENKFKNFHEFFARKKPRLREDVQYFQKSNIFFLKMGFLLDAVKIEFQ